MAEVSGSCRRFCSRWADADSRRMTDGFRIRLAAVDLEGSNGLEVEITVCCTELGRVTGNGGGRGGSAGCAMAEELK